MNKNKEISVDFIDRLKKIVTSRYKIATNNVKDIFFEQALYAHILNEYGNLHLMVKPNSLLSIFSLLSAEPKKTKEKLENSFVYIYERNNLSIKNIRINNYSVYLTQNLFNMIQFINLAVYLHKRYLYEERSKEERTILTKILIVSASNLYDELYSSRGKIEFAYYFKKILEHHDNINVSITPYNKESWRGEYAKYTRLAKAEIDKNCKLTNEREEIILISNIYIAYGKRIDERLPNLGERYFIRGIYVNGEDYNPIFIVTFS